MLGNTSKSKYATVGTVFPRFEDPEVEQAYLQDIAHENQSRVRIGFWFCVGILICVFIASIFISPSSGNLIWVAIAFGFLLLLRETPVQYLEYSLITIETIILSLLLMTNDFRIQRILPGYEIPDTGFNRAWDKCDTDLATHARDAFLICALFAVRSFLGVFIIRARLSWIGSACFCACFGFSVASPALRLDDGGGSAFLLLLLALASACL